MAPKRKRMLSLSSSETEMDPERETASSSGMTTYQVFLSFRGPDTRQGFTDFLYHELVREGIHVFRDDEEIRKGEDIGNEIRRAISESRIFVPIFSRGYAYSKWCLLELSKMFESMETSPGSNKKILPIFYDVGVDDVKLKTKLYAEALFKHGEKFSQDEVQHWEEVLRKAGKIKGWEVKDMGHGKFIKLFVTEVSTKLKVKHKFVTDCLVQRDDQVEALMNMLDIEASDVRFVSIHGMGGIGKTTLAKIVFNKLCDRYEHCSFLANVRESSQQHKGIEHLQKQLLADLGSTSRDIMHVDDGIMELSQKHQWKKVLIVIDDVDHRRQIQNLARDASWFGRGSRIIITTRNQEVLGGGVQTFKLIEMNTKEALQLFSKHAFDKDFPPNDYLNLSKEAVKSTGRLPLALEVIGSQLRQTPHRKWAKTIERLRKIPHKDVQEMLMISYESLSHGAQQIFLDIACFFINHERTIPMYMWEACKCDAKMGLKELIHKSLLKIVVENGKYSIGMVKVKKLWMHDQLRDLGRNIAEHSRIWMREDALKLLREEEGKVNVEMLRLCNNDYYYESEEKGTVSREEFSGLDKLRYLKCCGTMFSCNMRGLLPNLRWLHWRRCPKEFTGTGLSFMKLVILDLSYNRNITEDWTGWSKIWEANNLKVLDLSGCIELRKTPDLSNYSSLERLILQNCYNLVEIGPSIGELKGLKLLNVNGCISLKGFPDELCSLDCLEVVLGYILHPHQYFGHGKVEFSSFPESIGNLKSLLTLAFCLTKITRLPESIFRLSGLCHLSLRGIIELPQTVGLLEKLQTLELIDCEYMEKLPDSIGDMKSLVELHLPSSGITELPETIGNLEKLRVIDLSKSKIHKLPNSIGKLKSLEELNASSCDSLTKIPSTIKGCTSLRILNLRSCMRIKKLPDSIWCTQRRESDLTGRENIKELPVSKCFLRSLRELHLSYSGITELPDTIGSLKDLSILSLAGTWIRSLPASIGMLKNLEVLSAADCLFLEGIPSTIEGCTRLRELALTGCVNMKELPVSEYFLRSLVRFGLPTKIVTRPRSKRRKSSEGVAQMWSNLKIFEAGRYSLTSIPISESSYAFRTI